MKRTEIIPAILPLDFAELEEKVELIKGFVKTVQIDICDGQFVANATWPYKKHDQAFDKMTKEEIGLPGWEVLNYEFDLMVNRPEEVIDEWVSAGATRIIIHAEAKGDIGKAIASLQGRVEVGLALNIETPIDVIETYKDQITFVQCMGIDNIGFQGQAFDEKVLLKVEEIKIKYPNLAVSVDGGVSLDSAQLLIEAGVDRLVVGSAIFNSESAIDAVQGFKRL
jgi:ribulose-phosphate 3-epimerase